MSKNVLLRNEGILAVKMARKAIVSVFNDTDPFAEPEQTPIIFSEKRGVFVTLTKDGELRGCIGYPFPVLPFTEALIKCAVAAAFEDPRFFPIASKDLPKLCVEVTALTLPEPLDGSFIKYASMIEIGKHGLIAEYGEKRGVLLPQVATENKWDATEFLCRTCVKAGLTPMSWKYGTKIYRFEGQIFKETEPEGAVVLEEL